MNTGARLILLNITGCILFLALPVLFAPGDHSFLKELSSPPTIKDFIAYSLLIIYFYLNFFILIPGFYFKKKYFLFFLFTVACFAFITAIPNILVQQKPQPEAAALRQPPPQNENRPPPPPPGEDRNNISLLNHISHHLFLFLGVFFFSLLLKINNRWKKAEEEKLQTELSFLKAQVNPHFLFNTLNSIYYMALEKSDNTAPAVVKLSGMMRYVLTETDKDFVALEKEINYISSYIELQQIRYGDSIPLIYSVNGHTQGKQIAPLILMPFIENAFKYGMNAEENSSIKIEIEIEEKNISLLAENNKVFMQIPDEEKTGTGIMNVKERLQLLYPAKHSLHIKDGAGTFSVELKLTVA